MREERRLRVFENRVLRRIFGPKRDLTVREERRLRVFENRVLRGIFGVKRGEVTEELRKLQNAELNICVYTNFVTQIM